MAKPGPLPPPPSDLPDRKLPLRKWDAPWYRIHPVRYPHPVFFGKTLTNRFDDPRQVFGVMYLADDFGGAFAEVFGGSVRFRAVPLAALQGSLLSSLVATTPPQLVDLTGEGLLQVGADSRLFAGAHARAQTWARALHDHPQAPDGLLYRARHDPARFSVALFDHFQSQVTVTKTGAILLEPELRAVMKRYAFGIMP